MTQNCNVAFIGLGVMGYPMAGHLARAGHRLAVFNRSAAKAQRFASEFAARAAASPREAAEGADFVFSCVGNDDDLRAVTQGDKGAFAGMGKGAIFTDHTTASAEVARELFTAAREQGLGFLDAPISGGQAGAEKGQLTVMCGGDSHDFAKAQPVIAAYAKACRLMGPTGAGQLTKMVNQIAIAGLIQSLSEALNFATRAGLDAAAVVDLIKNGAAQSWQMENRAATMLRGEFDHGFAVEWMRKDLAICLEEARRNGAELPVAALVDQFYARVEQMGGARWDTSSLIAALRR
ncbi:NAD(P)-dependent oxidoreductase [Methylocystis bryophila]|uniref:Oxidoreductase n=1 Tax=Methylocystis bryophila TaxID=655015 RepID=A0A1W6MWU0_9HYPH|nr:NAD(P)-dependent oxidoreductase [Methylocystis bryophila]ARN82050.1 oxidoreductase [Methylocystis bryophila]BDV38171.1 dehydrogenase [Methylocystis bryophila]